MRSRSGLTSFALPDLEVGGPEWDERDGDMVRDLPHRKLLREERRVLEQHARGKGCSLIIDPTFKLANGPRAKRRRILTLVQFLSGMPDKRVRAVVRRRAPADPANVLLLGDWFQATSVSPRPRVGYRETLLTWHAPTVRRGIHEFDEELMDLLADQHLEPESSREPAIEALTGYLGADTQDP